MKTQFTTTKTSRYLPVLGVLILAGALTMGMSDAKATLLLNENFNYPIGSLGGNGSWVEVNPATDDIEVVTGNLTVSGLQAPTGKKIGFGGSGSDATHSFTSQTSGSVYYSFAMNVTDITSLSTTVFSPFVSLSATGLTDNVGAAVWARKDADNSSTYNLGLAKRTGAEFTTIELSLNTTYFVVVSYQFVAGVNNDIASMWIAPSSSSFGSTAPTATLTYANVEGDRAAFGSLGLTQSAAANTPIMEMDEIRIGNTWAEVTPVPEPTTIALLGLGVLGLAARRRRSARI